MKKMLLSITKCPIQDGLTWDPCPEMFLHAHGHVLRACLDPFGSATPSLNVFMCCLVMLSAVVSVFTECYQNLVMRLAKGPEACCGEIYFFLGLGFQPDHCYSTSTQAQVWPLRRASWAFWGRLVRMP